MRSTNDGVDNMEHNLRLFQAYSTSRRDLLTCLNNMLHPFGFRNLSNEEFLQLILHGHDNLYDSNAKILAMTIRYIHDPNRFERMTSSNFS